MKRRQPEPRSAGLQWLHERYVGKDPERVASFQAALANAHVARDIYRLRTQAGLTQKQLAERVGTTASVISRLEDAEYAGHSLSMLRRIAEALGLLVEIRFVPGRSRPASEPRTRRARPGRSSKRMAR